MERADRPHCDCHERVGIVINSLKNFQELKGFFSRQVSLGIFEDVPVKKPFYQWKTVKHYADKWYQCKVCGCLWEFIYPDFPAKGRVRKFPDGRYRDEEEETTRELAAKGKLAGKGSCS